VSQPCLVCGQDTEDDGYGEVVHVATGKYEGPEPDGYGHMAKVPGA
jgi:hypothetical protein